VENLLFDVPGYRLTPAQVFVHSYPECLGPPLLNQFVREARCERDGSFILTELVSGLPIRVSANRDRLYAEEYAEAGRTDLVLTLEPLRRR
jgi:hypothetical protein